MLFSGIGLVQAKPDRENPANDVERGVFVHYPHANAQAKAGGSQAASDQVNDFKYSGVHWAGTTPIVSYSVNPSNNQGLSAVDVAAAAGAAFLEWTDHNPNDGKYIRFIDNGLTDKNTPANPSRDFLNTVSFEPLSSAYPSAIAVTFYWYNRFSKELVEADTVFNSDFSWSIGGVANKYDLQNIATHEFGHWLVLSDLYSFRDSALTMYGYGYFGETIKSSLGKGDISGINRVY